VTAPGDFLEPHLLALEEQFWSGDAAFYRANVDAECLCAFPEMAGLLGREQVAATVPEGPRWRQLVIEPHGFRWLGDAAAILTYRAKAKRPTGEPYEALVSSAYVRRGEGWKLAFHQQTPLG
jgi:Domain of unknown function (DUF4440)